MSYSRRCEFRHFETSQLEVTPRTLEQPGVEDLAAITTHHARELERQSLPETYVIYCYYQFLKLDGLHKLQPREAQQLELTGSLHVPSGAIANEFVRQYFLHVHPCVPLLDEGTFWSLCLARDSHPGKDQAISLFVFQAMLLVASGYVSIEFIKACGFQSTRSARRGFHRRAQALLKSHLELDDLAIAQGSLLLSFQSSLVDQNINSSLLATAIGHAKKANAHLYYSEPTLTKEERHRRKRLWWSCILRDRIIALGVRRPMQITPDDFDFGQEPLGEADFVNEMEKSQVYLAATKRLLVEIVALQCQLAVAVTPLLMAMYPTRTSASPMAASVSQFIQSMARIEESKTELAVWARRSRIYATNQEPKDLLPQSDAQESVTLYMDLTKIYYLSARIALCHYSTSVLKKHHLFVDDCEPRVEDIKRDLESTMETMTDTVQSLIERGLARYLPVSIAAYTAMPFVLQSLNFKLSPAPQKPLRERQLSLYSELMRSLDLQYEHTDCVSAAVEKLLDFADAEFRKLSPSPEADEGDDQACGEKAVITTPGECGIKSWGEVIVHYPRFYLRLSLSLDYSLSRGSYPRDHELPRWVLGPYAQEPPLHGRSPSSSLTLFRPSLANPPAASLGQHKDLVHEQNYEGREPSWALSVEAIPIPGWGECAPLEGGSECDNNNNNSIWDEFAPLLNEMSYSSLSDNVTGMMSASSLLFFENENPFGIPNYSQLQ